MSSINLGLEAPWTVDTSFRDIDGHVLFHAVRAKTGMIVATTWAVPNEEAANLMSAAPALLAALKLALVGIGSARRPEWDEHATVAVIREAIDQAEGR